jgi:co-chaperonin GroES (HSP10)
MRWRNDNVLVKLVRGSDRIGSVVVPDVARTPGATHAQEAVVIGAGPGFWRTRMLRDRKDRPGAPGVPTAPEADTVFEATTVQPGDRVLLDSSLAGDRYDDDHRVVREAEILAILEEGSVGVR